MKFSFNLIKKFAPGKYNKPSLVEALNTYSFEAVDLGGDIIEVPNPAITSRFSSVASHLGIAREASVIFGTKFIDPTNQKIKPDFKNKGVFGVNIKEKKLCSRYSATYVTNIKIEQSPSWLRDILETCGLRSINNVVDIMNYVMLETGQPLHAFDADKVVGGLIVRKAKNKEKIETIDGSEFTLDENILVIADKDYPLAIAGIKGGKHAEVSLKTDKLLIESANFDSMNIYQSSKNLNLRTDASVSFSHNLTPELVEMGMNRALILLKEICGAKIYETEDFYVKKQLKKVIKFDLAKIEKIIGIKIKKTEAEKILSKLGFTIFKNLVTVPPLRNDVNIIEDLAEEIARFKNFNELPVMSPRVCLEISEDTELVIIKDRIREYLVATGYSETYNYSFISQEKSILPPSEIFEIKNAIKLLNPLSADFSYLRNSLAQYLEKNLNDNSRFYNSVRVFEIGKIFGNASSKKAKSRSELCSATGESLNLIEKTILGIAIQDKNSFLELKGVVDGLLGSLGLVDWFMPNLSLKCSLLEDNASLEIKTGSQSLGYAGILKNTKNGSVLEIDLDKLANSITEEKEYEPLSRFPSINRDISILVSKKTRVGDILNLIQRTSIQYVNDVDLMDFYEDEKFGDNKSLTFRIVFQDNSRTLTDQEVDREVQKIIKVLITDVNAEVR
ncbi:phenylalanine--tRNA ligase subunit beta [Patescibacteria group bacterium]|nr:phenylalanine--tRNA ligase subunit beta [Patescibacteria group bacterium]